MLRYIASLFCLFHLICVRAYPIWSVQQKSYKRAMYCNYFRDFLIEVFAMGWHHIAIQDEFHMKGLIYIIS